MTQPIRQEQSSEKTRNRLTHRTIEVYSPPSAIAGEWLGINCVIKVFREGIRGGKAYQSVQPTYYICSLSPHCSRLGQGIRQHWHIENRLHWVKDVVFSEDPSPKLRGWASINLSLLKSWVLNLLRIHGYDSITEAISYLSHNLTALYSLCR